ncbi:hypothetical protein HPB50_005169 [Hyalomma asiaticum]|uniref:Uncharacterized protein n=1 Tax=Hyalomma asiaticum TaxID=266040 RepID=A0ACB7RPA0_HYAAI|nr:hypothetical protein HPB50_005169 [Hyalomma asiaticum]
MWVTGPLPSRGGGGAETFAALGAHGWWCPCVSASGGHAAIAALVPSRPAARYQQRRRRSPPLTFADDERQQQKEPSKVSGLRETRRARGARALPPSEASPPAEICAKPFLFLLLVRKGPART